MRERKPKQPMQERKLKQPMTWKRIMHGIFQWQTLLVATAFLAMACFLAYVCGNIAAPFRIQDIASAEYKASEQMYLWIFAAGSFFSLGVAIFAAYMVDHNGAIKNLFKKIFGHKNHSGGQDTSDQNSAQNATKDEGDKSVLEDKSMAPAGTQKVLAQQAPTQSNQQSQEACKKQ